MTPSSGRWSLFAVAILVSAVVVVGAFDPAPHSGGDNAGYLSLAHSLVTAHAYLDAYDPAGLPHTKYPPVFPGVLALLILLGARTWTAFKALAAVSTVAGIGATYLWAERRLGPWPALAVALLVATSSSVVYYSHWILSDPLFVFLTMASLWALERADGDENSGGEAGATRWLVVGVAAAGFAYFTRSAGLPLLVALLAWLAFRRRWRSLAGSAVALGVPAFLWWLRGRGVGVADYGTEFWMVDPYDPGQGRVGIGGLLGRAVSNGWAYMSSHIPSGIVGVQAPHVALLGLLLLALAAFGWYRRLGERLGPAELFLPLYTGLILLWPGVWGGDRFVLPILPLLFLYAAGALRVLGARLGGVAPALLAGVAVAGVLIPAGGAWARAVRAASECGAVVERLGPFACYGPRVVEFTEAAAWMGTALPDGAAVMSRKPRMFYLMSGIPSRTFPFDDDPAVQLAAADEVGARYVLLDQWDGLALRYVGGAVRQQPTAYCIVRGFGPAPGQGAQLLGILPPGQRGLAGQAPAASGSLALCPADYARASVPEPASASSRSLEIPLLARSLP